MGVTIYDREKITAEICARISEGETLRAICRDDHMPNYSVVYDWMAGDEGFAQRFAHAREVGESAIGADCLSIADEPPALNPNGGIDGGHVQHQKLRIWTRLELLKRWNPKKWGDRIAQEVSGPDGGPVQHNVAVDPSEAYKRMIEGG